MPVCTNCFLSFETYNKLRFHKRKIHQTSAVAHFNGKSIQILRDSENNFTCRKCKKKSQDPRFVLRHTKCYFDHKEQLAVEEESKSQQYESITTAIDIFGQTTPDQILQRYNLFYDIDTKYLYCINCKIILDAKFTLHLQKKHHVFVTKADLFLIQNTYEILPFSQPLEILKPLKILPVQKGYICKICSWCCLYERNMKKHSQLHGENGLTYMETHLQSNSMHHRNMFFPVDSHDELEVLGDTTEGRICLDDVLKKALSSINEQSTLIENQRERNIFYLKLGWFAEGEMEILRHLQVDQYFQAPNFFIPYFEMVKRYILKRLEDVDRWNWTLRIWLGDQKYGNAFRSLEKQTAISYADLYMQFICFLFNFCIQPIPFYSVLSADFINRTNELRENFTILDLMELLWEVLYEPLPDHNKGLAITFLRLKSYKNCNQLESVENVGRCGAKLIYFTKVLFNYRAEKNSNLQDYIEKNIHFLTATSPTIFADLVNITGFAKKIDSTTLRFPNIIETFPGKIIRIKGKRLELWLLGKVYLQNLAEASQRIEILLLGLKVSVETKFLEDNFTLRRQGYSFGYNSTEKRDDAKVKILEQILKNPALAKEYIFSFQDNSIQWNVESLHRYVELYDKYIENLLMIIHLGSGLPARASELSTLTVENGQSNLRSLFLHDNLIFIFAQYNKTNNLRSKSSDIIRFLDIEASNILIKDLLFVRPFVKLVTKFLEMNSNGGYGKYLFARKGIPMNTNSMTACFASQFYSKSGVPIGFSEYRHVAKYASRIVIRNESDLGDEDSDDEAEGENDFACRQFGHSRAISEQRYSITEGIFQRHDRVKLEQFKNVSTQWQNFLRSTTLDHSRSKIAVHSVGPTSGESEMAFCTDNDRSSDSQIFRVEKGRLHSRLKPVQNMASLMKLYLDRLLGKEDSCFNSQEQEDAVKAVLFTEANVIVILPTGGGKSMLFFLDCLHEPNFTNLIITPTIALRNDMFRRSWEFGISACCDIESFDGENLLILVTDNAVSRSTMDFLENLAAKGNLGKIFIDEAHSYVTDSNYRQSMKKLQNLVTLERKIILLTATGPEWITDILKRDFFPRSTPIIIKASTNRSNISYSVSRNMSRENIFSRILLRIATYQEEERMIVYFATVKSIEFLAGKLGNLAVSYNSQISEEERKIAVSAWRSGSSKIMLATSGFGQGIDYGQVRDVMFYALPYSLEEYVQVSGRAGRDGKNANSCLFFADCVEKQREYYLKNPEVKKAYLLMKSFAEQTSQCRRLLISRYMDNMNVCCKSRGQNLCDVCMENVGVKRFKDGDESEASSGDEFFFVSEQRREDSLFIEKKLYGKEGFEVMVRYKFDKVRGFCPVCLAKDQFGSFHTLDQCKLIKNVCWKCLGLAGSKAHFANFCPLPSFEMKGHCVRCYLPFTDENFGWHNGENDQKNSCLNNFVREYAMALFKYQDTNGLSVEEYWKYLHTERDGFLNCLGCLSEIE